MSINMEGEFEAALARIDAAIWKLRQPYSPPLDAPWFPTCHPQIPIKEVTNPHLISTSLKGAPIKMKFPNFKEVKLPNFKGGDPTNWILEVEHFFDFYGISDAKKLKYAWLGLSGSATLWYYKHIKPRIHEISWSLFLEKLIDQFDSTELEDSNKSMVVDEENVIDDVSCEKNRDGVVFDSLENLEMENYRSDKSSKMFDELGSQGKEKLIDQLGILEIEIDDACLGRKIQEDVVVEDCDIVEGENQRDDKATVALDKKNVTWETNLMDDYEEKFRTFSIVIEEIEEKLMFAKKISKMSSSSVCGNVSNTIFPNLELRLSFQRNVKRAEFEALKCVVGSDKIVLDGWPPPICKNVARVFLLRGESQRDFVADRVLRLLCRGKGEFAQGKPIWQLLLAFLYRRNCYASVSVLCADGRSFDGVLKPFTINYGFLSVVEKRSVDLCQLVGVSIIKDGKGKRNKMQKSLLNGVSWSSFCEQVYRQVDDDGTQEMELEEIYFADETNKSKKLRFLKCWMRQVVKKSSDCCQSKQTEVEEHQNVDEEVKERVEDSSLPLTQESHCSGGPINQESCSVPYLEDLEAFLASIPQKVENGLSTKEVELSSLAARLVAQSIDAIFAKSGSNSSNESQVFSQVSHLLLVKPKDLALKYKSSDSETNDSTERIIRVNELQILLRMEILGSKIAESFGGNVKLRMVKEICSLLQNIEFYLQGNFFCGESLLEFAGRTIKSRYSQTLGDIIRKIYDKMEFFSFDDNDMEASDPALVSNSEEAIGDWNGNNDSPKTNALEPTAAHLNENNEKNQLNVHEKRLIQAQKTRDRARRFSSFTSWVPDLHRVWALKHPKVEKPELDSVLKIQSKRMKKKKTKYEMVCETPVPRTKQTRLQEDESSGSDSVCPDTNPCRLRSKALFQH